MSPHPSDAWIDDQLKNVAVPGVVIQKLHAIASLDDAELDRALCDVAPTAQLLERLRSIGSLDENDINDELRHVELPVSLAERLRRIPRAIDRRVRTNVLMRRLAIAASLLIAAVVGYLAAVSPSYFGRPQQQTPGAIATTGGPAEKKGRESTNRPASVPSVATVDKNDVDLVKNGSRDESSNGATPVEPSIEDRNDSTTGQFVENRQNNADQAIVSENVLGANVVANRLPPIESLPPPLWRGITPPRNLYYDLRFQLTHGVHPFVSPAANPALLDCPVPLVTSTDSFDDAILLTAERKLPPAPKIRTEEFLAAMDYGLSPPENAAVGVRTAVGPSPWGASGSSLLQVAVQAKALSRDERRGSHLVAILDASATMRWDRRWQVVRRGLRDYAERMRPSDRLTLVLMGEKPELVAERLASTEALSALDSLPDQPSAKMVGTVDALVLASDAAGRGLSDGSGRIVLLTDGALDLDQPALEKVQTILQASGANALRFEVFDLRQEETIDAELDQLAAAAAAKEVSSGAVAHVATAGDLRWRLLELVDGRSQLVAAKATMKVKFRPDAVAMYRLIGHESTSIATSIAGLTSATVEADLRSGEVATGLFDIVLKPDGGETIATVEVTWKDPKTGAVQKAEQTVSRLQIAPSFYQAPLSLQMAALAAETAEILRGSPFPRPTSHSVSNVAELGAVLNSRLRSRPSFVRLMTLVEQAQRSHATQ